MDSTHRHRPARPHRPGRLIERVCHSVATTINTDPSELINTLGMDSANIVHQTYTPGLGWEIAVEEQQQTIIIICEEKTGLIKAFK